jgi:hypothetical protein
VDFVLTAYLTQFGRLPGNFQIWEQWQVLSTQWYTTQGSFGLHQHESQALLAVRPWDSPEVISIQLQLNIRNPEYAMEQCM